MVASKPVDLLQLHKTDYNLICRRVLIITGRLLQCRLTHYTNQMIIIQILNNQSCIARSRREGETRSHGSYHRCMSSSSVEVRGIHNKYGGVIGTIVSEECSWQLLQPLRHVQILSPADTCIMKILLNQKSVHVALRQRSRSPVFAFQNFSLCVCGARILEG